MVRFETDGEEVRPYLLFSPPHSPHEVVVLSARGGCDTGAGIGPEIAPSTTSLTVLYPGLLRGQSLLGSESQRCCRYTIPDESSVVPKIVGDAGQICAL